MLKLIKFTVQTDWPVDRKHTPDDADCDGFDWHQHITLDLIPRKGDLVSIGGDYLEVEGVYITPTDDGSAIEVHLDGGPILSPTTKSMAAAGWKED